MDLPLASVMYDDGESVSCCLTEEYTDHYNPCKVFLTVHLLLHAVCSALKGLLNKCLQ